MHLSSILLPLLALGISPAAFAAPILSKPDLILAHSNSVGGMQMAFAHAPSVATEDSVIHAKEKTHPHPGREVLKPADMRGALVFGKRSLEEPEDFKTRPKYVAPKPPARKTRLAITPPESGEDHHIEPKLIARGTKESGEEKADHKQPTGRVIWLGRKLARLFYHGRSKHQNKNAHKASAHNHDEKHSKVQDQEDA